MFKKLNALIVGRIERKHQQSMSALIAVRADDRAITVETRAATSGINATTAIDWKSISRVAAVRQPNYVGDDIVLMIEHAGGAIKLTHAVAGFDALLNSIEHHLHHKIGRAHV